MKILQLNKTSRLLLCLLTAIIIALFFITGSSYAADPQCSYPGQACLYAGQYYGGSNYCCNGDTETCNNIWTCSSSLDCNTPGVSEVHPGNPLSCQPACPPYGGNYNLYCTNGQWTEEYDNGTCGKQTTNLDYCPTGCGTDYTTNRCAAAPTPTRTPTPPPTSVPQCPAGNTCRQGGCPAGEVPNSSGATCGVGNVCCIPGGAGPTSTPTRTPTPIPPTPTPAAACNVSCVTDTFCNSAQDGCTYCNPITDRCERPTCGSPCSVPADCNGVLTCTACLPDAGSPTGRSCQLPPTPAAPTATRTPTPTPVACNSSCATNPNICQQATGGCNYCNPATDRCETPPACNTNCTGNPSVCNQATGGCTVCSPTTNRCVAPNTPTPTPVACSASCATNPNICQQATGGCTFCNPPNDRCETPPACNTNCTSNPSVCNQATGGCTYCNPTSNTCTVPNTPTPTPVACNSSCATNPNICQQATGGCNYCNPATDRCETPPACNTNCTGNPSVCNQATGGCTYCNPTSNTCTVPNTPTPTPTPLPFDESMCACDQLDYTTPLALGTTATITAWGKVEGVNTNYAKIPSMTFTFYKSSGGTAAEIIKKETVPTTQIENTPQKARYQAVWDLDLPLTLDKSLTYRIQAKADCSRKSAAIYNAYPTKVVLAESTNQSFWSRIVDFFRSIFRLGTNDTPATVVKGPTPTLTDEQKQLQLKTFIPARGIATDNCSFIKFNF